MGGHVSIDDGRRSAAARRFTGSCVFAGLAFVGGASAVRKDVPPYVKAAGSPLELYGLNSVGLQRTVLRRRCVGS